ncbi:hypothetical protein Gasu2_44010 [Galdieria sulphuraria]|uniref:Uncharacterized protein n=1 Tax=Galdieria sulphuraria TaxID=130081 RepID=M2XCU5_GALSU|nr:uncharacterized protein Gasu_47630 [Galdieria sulphuraria]EME27777.1 hypothetical protein Gasu_47630 [Galdieria sulphuraria]GJD10193.1 hypothetical protein Gasu2_44010 [Galdieria sulphuraria]|eukprot:XP_005704297.1 hypothetical protein Gasu_47630 [Galdieria sulphuraria]
MEDFVDNVFEIMKLEPSTFLIPEVRESKAYRLIDSFRTTACPGLYLRVIVKGSSIEQETDISTGGFKINSCEFIMRAQSKHEDLNAATNLWPSSLFIFPIF